MSHFDRLLNPTIWGGDGDDARKAAVEVGDMLRLCAAWWQQYSDVKPTASDLLTMCKMMLQRERELQRARQRAEQLLEELEA